jgi:4-amino-4-deoxy-L-arabinose transferase-like glycosyltransferase
MAMNRNSLAWVIGVIFLLIAGATRFYRIGWSVSGDHTTMMDGVESLRTKPFFSLEGLTPGERQARMIPLPHLLQGLAYDAFGHDEAGVRTGSAIAGAVIIAIAAMAVTRVYGPASGVILGSMLVTCAWLLGSHQSNRHYSYAFLFGSLAILATATSWRRNSILWGLLAGACTALAVAMHTVLFALLMATGVFMVIEAFLRKSPVPRRSVWAYWVTAIPLTACALAPFIWCMLAYKGPPVDWGYSSFHSVAGLVLNLGPSVAVLALIGFFLPWRGDDVMGRLCAVIAAAAVMACAVLPLVHSFRHDYVLPMSLSFFMLASGTATAVYDAVRRHRGRALAVAVTAMLVAMPLPSLASYYQDGDRHDYRAAAQFIKNNAKPADIVASDSPGCLGYYLPTPVETGHRIFSRPDAAMAALDKLAAGGRRVWYVCRYSRESLEPDADRWLWRNAVRMRQIKKQRFDYHENIVDVYLIHGKQDKRQP